MATKIRVILFISFALSQISVVLAADKMTIPEGVFLMG